MYSQPVAVRHRPLQDGGVPSRMSQMITRFYHAKPKLSTASCRTCRKEEEGGEGKRRKGRAKRKLKGSCGGNLQGR